MATLICPPLSARCVLIEPLNLNSYLPLLERGVFSWDFPYSTIALCRFISLPSQSIEYIALTYGKGFHRSLASGLLCMLLLSWHWPPHGHWNWMMWFRILAPFVSKRGGIAIVLCFAEPGIETGIETENREQAAEIGARNKQMGKNIEKWVIFMWNHCLKKTHGVPHRIFPISKTVKILYTRERADYTKLRIQDEQKTNDPFNAN